MQETRVQSLVWEDPMEKGMATHSSVLAWRIPGMGEPAGLPSMGSHRVGHDWSDLAAAAAASLKWTLSQTTVCVCVCVLVSQLCLTLCDPVYCSLPGSSVPQILQARMLQWVTISFSGGSSHHRDQSQVSFIKTDSLPSEPHYSKYIIYIVPQRRQLEVIFDFPIYFTHI